MPPVNRNQKLANAAYKLVVQSGRFPHGTNEAYKMAFARAKFAHLNAHRPGPGPNAGHILTAAIQHEIKEMNKLLKKK
jgi:hypothetical protein